MRQYPPPPLVLFAGRAQLFNSVPYDSFPKASAEAWLIRDPLVDVYIDRICVTSYYEVSHNSQLLAEECLGLANAGDQLRVLIVPQELLVGDPVFAVELELDIARNGGVTVSHLAVQVDVDSDIQ